MSTNTFSMAECFQKSRWCSTEQVCQGVKCCEFEQTSGMESGICKNAPFDGPCR